MLLARQTEESVQVCWALVEPICPFDRVSLLLTNSRGLSRAYFLSLSLFYGVA
jgi:hypothetical protein